VSDPTSTPDDVLAYYGSNVESDRLAVGKGALEFERTKEIILRFLQPGSAIADIGGATGRYAEWLASNGHRVDLVDPVPLHVELARRLAGDPPRFGVHLGDARTLPFVAGSFDAVLLLGPLYHLEEEHDRADAVREAMRVCRRGGLIFAAAISRFAPLLNSICRGEAIDEQVFANVQAETLTGHRVPEDRRTSQFPEAYYHLPSEFTDELTEAGLDVQGIYGIEGPGWLLNDIETTWLEADARERILWAARALETDPNLIAVSDHFLAVATT